MASEEEISVPEKRAPPKRSQPSRTSTRSKQTTLNFSQSQAQKPSGKAAPKALEISDDEISEEDAFGVYASH